MTRSHPNSRRELPAICIVEDDAPLREAISFSLAAEGYRVRAFRTGEEFLAAEDLEDAGCLVIDRNLPDLGGLEVIEALRRRGCETPSVMITTAPGDALLDACWRLGVPVVEKPLLGDSLNSCIRGLLAQPRPQSPGPRARSPAPHRWE